MDNLIRNFNQYHISYSGNQDKPGAVLFDPTQCHFLKNEDVTEGLLIC